MNKNQIIGFTGGIILLLSLLTPLAYVNEGFITIVPLFENMNLNDAWLWRDISAFAVTIILLGLLSFYFILKKNSLGTLIVGTLIFIDFFFVLVAVWMSSLNAEKYADIQFRFSYGWIVALIGAALIIYSGVRMKKPNSLQK